MASHAPLADFLELLLAAKRLLPDHSPFKSRCWAMTPHSHEGSTDIRFCPSKVGEDSVLCLHHSVEQNLSPYDKGSLRLAATLALRTIELHHAYLECKQFADELAEQATLSSHAAVQMVVSSPTLQGAHAHLQIPDVPTTPKLQGASGSSSGDFNIVAEAATLRHAMSSLQLQLEREKGTSEAAAISLSVLRDSERALAQAYGSLQEEHAMVQQQLAQAQRELAFSRKRIAELQRRSSDHFHVSEAGSDEEEGEVQQALESAGARALGTPYAELYSRGTTPAATPSPAPAPSASRLPLSSSSLAKDASPGRLPVRESASSDSPLKGGEGSLQVSPASQGSPQRSPGPKQGPQDTLLALEDTLQAARISLRPAVPLAVRSPAHGQGVACHNAQPASQEGGSPSQQRALALSADIPVTAALDARAATSLRAAEVSKVGIELAKLGELRRRMDMMTRGGAGALVQSGSPSGSKQGKGEEAAGGDGLEVTAGTPTKQTPRKLTLRLGSSPLARQVAAALQSGGQARTEGSLQPMHEHGLAMLDLSLEEQGQGVPAVMPHIAVL